MILIVVSETISCHMYWMTRALALSPSLLIDSDSVTVYNRDMQETEQHYTIEELAELVGLSVRTIRYYIGEGLLPGPGARGKAAIYGEEHLLKLRLIRRLSEQRMPLAEMQTLLSHLSLAEVRTLLEEEEQRAGELKQVEQHTQAKEYIEKLLKNAQTARRSSPSAPPPAPLPGGMPVVPPAIQPYAPAHETWRRWELAPGIELHIRSDAEYRQRSLIERLFRVVGMIFQPSHK